ncbi:hypothetical protein DN752_23725 [Echinicola strongylocentroti]|uniref:Uncharacterized protein n=1 Tax=Echinicola strongylocentroti TaxID=1795355 RepID=A0A2Z4IQ53_9BACT|nr:hypothetical protein [Echinicola strongylocentroti]AWW32900.1 hypothetical protein DN752_23725 [Echinicola strongylocentroti]
MKYLFKPINLKRWGLYVLASLWMLSCVEDADKVHKAALLKWDTVTLSAGGPTSGGSVSVKVDWAFIQWNMQVEELLEGVGISKNWSTGPMEGTWKVPLL